MAINGVLKNILSATNTAAPKALSANAIKVHTNQYGSNQFGRFLKCFRLFQIAHFDLNALSLLLKLFHKNPAVLK